MVGKLGPGSGEYKGIRGQHNAWERHGEKLPKSVDLTELCLWFIQREITLLKQDEEKQRQAAEVRNFTTDKRGTVTSNTTLLTRLLH